MSQKLHPLPQIAPPQQLGIPEIGQFPTHLATTYTVLTLSTTIVPEASGSVVCPSGERQKVEIVR
jgi:hypothetical protein